MAAYIQLDKYPNIKIPLFLPVNNVIKTMHDMDTKGIPTEKKIV